MLVFHLKRNVLLYASPLPFAIVGTFLLALGYGMDLDERVGCGIIPFGSVAAPCFPALVMMSVVYAKERRKGSAAEHAGGRRKRRAVPSSARGEISSTATKRTSRRATANWRPREFSRVTR